MVVPSLKSHVSSELLPSEWVAMKCQMRVQMDGWLRVRGLERQSFTLLKPKELSFIGLWQVAQWKWNSTATYRYLYEASSFMATVATPVFFHSGNDFTRSIFLINTVAFDVLVGLGLHYDHIKCHFLVCSSVDMALFVLLRLGDNSWLSFINFW